MENRIKQIIKEEFNAETLLIRRITEGYSHYMYEVTTNKQPFRMIIRFSNNKKEDVNLGKEKYVMDLLRKNNIPVPKIYSYSHKYMIMEKFSGIRLDTIWESLTKEEKIQITRKIGKLLSKIHHIKLEKFGIIKDKGKIKSDEPFKFRKMGEYIEYNKFLREWLKAGLEDLARILSYKHISKELIIEIFRYLTTNLHKIEYSGEPVLIHGDFMPDHIFVEKINNNYEIIGLIDFEFALSYAPEYDFIKLHRKGFFNDENLKKALKEGYGEINEEAVEIHRIMRDLGFAWVVLESGDKSLSDKTLKDIEKRIKTKL